MDSFKMNKVNFRYKESDFAIQNFSFQLNKGEIVGLVGENGAGKSTLLNLIAGLEKSKSGDLFIDGKKITIDDRKNKISYLPTNFELYEYLSLYENLFFICSIRHLNLTIEYLQNLLKDIGLWERRNDSVCSLSTGLKQKFYFLIVTIHQPEFLIIDEPFTGLDPKQILIFQDKIRDFARNGGCVLFSSHILDFVANLCEKVILIKDGLNIEEVQEGKAAEVQKYLENYFRHI
ncbi:MAG: ABC transporter ATP-binding protein [Streptococcaceae bacterium]|jgi:ABC-2 type transport system ATP-binding protein|nr:ABC transporter ATP-binding protein [Streptococcaceae bacterium]